MRAVVFAYHLLGHRGLSTLLELGVEVAAVVTHADDPAEDVWFPSVAELAASRGIPVATPRAVNAPAWIERVRGLAPDALFSFHYRRLLAAPFLALPPLGAFNLHASLLPRYRGRCPINWVLIHRETRTGVTLHHMVEEADAGDIVAQREVTIAPRETALTLTRRLADVAGDLLGAAVPGIAAGTAPRRPQDSTRVSVFGRRRPEDGRIDWRRPAEEIDALVRAVTRPWPGAFAEVPGGARLTVWESEPVGPGGAEAPGTVVSREPFEVATGAGRLRIVTAAVGAETLAGVAAARALGPVERLA